MLRLRDVTHGATALALALCMAVGTSCATRPGATHHLEGGWGGLGCVPRGEALTLRGTVLVRPFGKGTDGVFLRVAGGERWIVRYSADGVLRELAGARVIVTGRACDKQGEALAGPHLDIETITRAR
ncbi:MAG: hypothetical protein H6713_07130 [Myxococcales bacterium]|nr:hypothetical protein [Myxococcales bacterium]MCB9749763.1 hypothetical protein [Myxococcales bacterium]